MDDLDAALPAGRRTKPSSPTLTTLHIARQQTLAGVLSCLLTTATSSDSIIPTLVRKFLLCQISRGACSPLSGASSFKARRLMLFRPLRQPVWHCAVCCRILADVQPSEATINAPANASLPELCPMLETAARAGSMRSTRPPIVASIASCKAAAA